MMYTIIIIEGGERRSLHTVPTLYEGYSLVSYLLSEVGFDVNVILEETSNG